MKIYINYKLFLISKFKNKLPSKPILKFFKNLHIIKN